MDVEIPAEGAVLRGRLARPDGPPRAMVLVSGATGVPARFYRAFADWLAEQGLACLTYDYRDFGASGSARDSRATMTDWGVRDQQAARDFAAHAVPDVPLWVVGHSLGGMTLPFQTGLERIDRVICVASGAVHVSDHPWPYQAFARAFWAPGLPWLARRLGHLPLQRVGVGHDIPAGVYAQWRRWCLSRRFHGGDPALGPARPDDLTCAVRMVAVADDALCPPASVWRLMQAYPAARKSQVVIRPEALGLDRLGHLHVLGEHGRAAWPILMDLA
ncbi:MAG: alpha/beta fold hydrolase [Pseudomonadota bacterium]